MSRAFGRSRKGLSLTAVAAAALLALSACSGGGAPKTEQQNQGGGGGGGGAGITIAMVTHEPPGDTFWTKVQNGARQAAKDTGVTLKYSADPESNKQATLVQARLTPR
jgi:simple sugar transport system substrate-binding protein